MAGAIGAMHLGKNRLLMLLPAVRIQWILPGQGEQAQAVIVCPASAGREYQSGILPFYQCGGAFIDGKTDPDSLTRSYRELKEKGFTAAKIFVNGPVKSTNDGRDEFFSGRIHDEVEKVRICREAVGDDFDFVLEVHRGMTVPEAISFAREVEPYRPMILEDPITPDNIDAMAEVAQKTRIPIATGERFINLKEFEMLMQRRAAQYVRPDVCAIGGITTTKKICAIAEANDVLVIPHNPLGPVSTAACLQICACIPNLGIQELPGFCLNGAEDAMVKTPLAYKCQRREKNNVKRREEIDANAGIKNAGIPTAGCKPPVNCLPESRPGVR